MSQLLRGFYRIFIKNRFIRWAWMLALVLWGVKVGTDRGLAWTRAPLSKTVLALPAKSIATFTIRRNEDDETTFTLVDTGWLVVKNNITVRLPADSVADFLSVFEKMEGINVNVLNTKELEQIKSKYNFDVIVTQKNNINHTFSVYYNDRDTFSNGILTYIKFPNENSLHGIKGDLLTLFGRDFDDYRDKTLLNFSRDTAIYMTIKSPVDSFSFIRKDSTWLSRDKRYRLSQNAFRSYLSSLEILRGGKFFDEDRDILRDSKIDKQLFVFMPSDTLILTSYKLEKGYVLHSNQNNEAYFRADSTTNIFPNLSNFLLPK